MTTIDRIQELLTYRDIPKRGMRRALERTCGISYQAVSQWFTGETSNIKNEHLAAIAQEYGSSLDWLISGKGPMVTDQEGQSSNAGSDLEITKRVDSELCSRQWSRADLARKLGYSEQRLMNWWKRGIPASEHVRVAKVLDWSVDRLIAGHGKPETNSPPKENHTLSDVSVASDLMTAPVPVMDQEFSAGQGATAEKLKDFVDGHRDINLSDLAAHGIQPSNARIIKIRGDSMWPTLWGGDEVLADTYVPRLTSSKIYAFEFDGELKVKRFTKKMDGSWLISSDNKDDPAYTDEIVSAHNAQQLRVIAEVKKLVSRNL